MVNNRLKMVIVIFIVFLLVYLIGFIILMNFDDYIYVLREFLFFSIKMYYLGWSGRVVLDMFSIFLLKFFFLYIYNVINLVVLILMVLCWIMILVILIKLLLFLYVMIFLFFL